MQRNYKKFALVGTSCVGKTTLLHELSKTLVKKYPQKKVVTVPEAARLYFALVKSKNPFSFYEQRNVQALAKELENHMTTLNPHIILTDRSVIDAVAYLQAMGKHTASAKLTQYAKDWLKTYDHLFLLDPADIVYAKDKIRKESQKTRSAFHSSFLSVLPKSKVSWTLISGTKKKRLAHMLEIIERYGN